MPKGKKPLDPTLRYGDVVPVWEAVLRDGSGIIQTRGDNHTITLVYRLNQYRKAVRETTNLPYTDMDRFIVRRGYNCVEILPRITMDYLSVMTKLDGTPSSRPTYESKPTPSDDFVKQYAEKPGRLIDDEPVDKDPDLSSQDRKTIEEVERKLRQGTRGE